MYQAPRGTADILPEQQKEWRFIEAKAQEVARRFGYQRIDTPIFEDAGLFVRSIGQGTDIVEKETYTFEDRGGDLLTLRPEGTASVCRAYLQHGMHNLPQPVRLYYLCPIFRYERPQSGRYREHHQFGIEALGDGDPSIDAEIIEVGWRFLEEVGLSRLSLRVNSIGDPRCRPGYIQALRSHYSVHKDRICADCKVRLERNPLRLLDCKEESCLVIAAGAPHTIGHLCGDCREHWDRLLSYLTLLDLPYQIDDRLVRGLDYYTRSVFEIQPPEEGGQSTILGGGRYDGLIQELDGRPTPGIGFGMGMERVVANLRRQGVVISDEGGIRVVIAHMGDAAKEEAIRLSSRLRVEGVSAVVAPSSKSLRGQMRHASAMGAAYTVIIGDDELKRGTVMLRDMAKGEQQEVKPDALGRVIKAQAP